MHPNHIRLIASTIFFSSWIIFFKPNMYVMYSLTIASSFVILSFNIKNGINFSLHKVLFLIFLIFIWFPKNNNINDVSIGLLFSFIFIWLLFTLPYYIKNKLIYFLKKIFVLIVLAGLVVYLVDLNSLYNFSNFFPNIIENERNYTVYPFLVIEKTNLQDFYRFQSIFDEPGYLATISFFFLLLDNFDFKKYSNIILFIGGLLSFSVAFYIMSALYILITISKSKLKNKIIILAAVFLTAILFSLEIDTLILDRVNILDTGLKGDNRGGILLQAEAIMFLFSNDVLLWLYGNGINFTIPRFDKFGLIADSTFVRLFYQLGLIPLTLFAIFLVRNTKRSFKEIVFILFFVLSIYQRPQIFEPIFMILLFLGMGNKKYFELEDSSKNQSKFKF